LKHVTTAPRQRRIARPALAAALTAAFVAAFAALVGLGGALAGTNGTAGEAQYDPPGTILLPGGRKSIPATSVAAGERLVIDGVRFTPNPVRSRARAIRLRVHVSDTRGFVVRGALIFARSTPLVTRSAGEIQTNTQGFAFVNLLPRANLPLRNGYAVQFFIRARRAGDNLLAGISSRRLAQVRTASPR
jgi:hypothetical protein